ncbi:TSUP family transporter [Vibrio salinus]|uniref:TSUP family transporter n=1 Tax=Vibrio salinus TaxID=2899784 RepID=UPI001E385B52|nr:TSUP family transporter [Vibrio salinus]MCE0494271.1 TSUP family transporter [Vibrio salinus]
MDVSIDILGLLFLAGSLAGFIDAIAGGGGLITVPALLAAGVPPAQALATNKLQSSFGSFSATFYFVRTGLVSLKQLRFAIFCTFCGAATGAELVQNIDATILTSLIPILLIGISLYFLFAPSTKPGKAKISENQFALIVGFCIGFYDGFFGPGTGSLFTVCFIVLGGLSIIEATARTKVLNFTSNISALTFFLVAGLPVWKIGLVMAVGQFLGARMGAKVVVTKGQKWIRPLVIIMSMAMALKLLWEQHQDWFVGLF